MTVIFEYVLPATKTTREWAAAWHSLGSFESYDEPYRTALEQVTNAFTARNADPKGPGGSALGQIRTNESTFDWIWQMREFGIGDDGMLALRLPRNTPAEAFNSTPALAAWVTANEASIRGKRFELPRSFRGPSVDQLLFSWQLPTINQSLRDAFAKQTCNGCHSFDNPSVDTVFHVSPFRSGTAKLSRFVNDPDGKSDELTSRTASLQRALCSGT